MVNSETGVIPFQATFGTEDLKFLQLPETLDSRDRIHAYVQRLDNNLKNLRAASKRLQDELVLERAIKTPTATQNVYQLGDSVFFERNKSVPRVNKLAPDFLGPFEVVSQSKNDVQCRNLIYGHIKPMHVTKLKPFFGTREEAYDLAKKDTDQFEVDRILANRGDPDKRGVGVCGVGHVLFICSYKCLLLLVGDTLGAVVLSVGAVEAQVVAVEVAV